MNSANYNVDYQIMFTSCDAATVYIYNDPKFSTVREAHAIESYFKEIRRMFTPFREIVSK